MAVTYNKSQAITNRDAKPAVPNNAAIVSADVLRASGLVTVNTGDSIGSTYACFQIPSSALISSLKISNPAIGTTPTVNVGIYETTKEELPGTTPVAVNATLYATGFSIHAANTKAQLLYASLPVSDSEMYLWQLLGLAADPLQMYDVVLTLAAASDGTGAVELECEYAV